MTDRPSTSRPGFQKALFGHDPSQVDAAIDELQTRLEAAERDAQVARARVRELEEAQSPIVGAPTFDDLGARVVAILNLAEEEAAEQRGAAETEAQRNRAEALAAAESSQAAADRYAERVRAVADTEAAQVRDEARRLANDVVEDAEREASARRAEAEALFETYRANAAAAAADLERSLAARRDQAATEITAQLEAHEASLQAAEARALHQAKQSEAAFEEARGMATTHVAQAEEQAALILQRARAQADRITRSSEREVTAASARRDSINVQLDNLRQMLATLGGPGVAEQLLGQEWAAAQPADAPDATAHDVEVVQSGGAHNRSPAPDSSTSWYETLQNEEPAAGPVDPPVVDAVEGQGGGTAPRSAADQGSNGGRSPRTRGRGKQPA